MSIVLLKKKNVGSDWVFYSYSLGNNKSQYLPTQTTFPFTVPTSLPSIHGPWSTHCKASYVLFNYKTPKIRKKFGCNGNSTILLFSINKIMSRKKIIKHVILLLDKNSNMQLFQFHISIFQKRTNKMVRSWALILQFCFANCLISSAELTFWRQDKVQLQKQKYIYICNQKRKNYEKKVFRS